MIRKGSDYIDSIKDNREVYMDGERVKDITIHPMFKPIIDISPLYNYPISQHNCRQESTYCMVDTHHASPPVKGFAMNQRNQEKPNRDTQQKPDLR